MTWDPWLSEALKKARGALSAALRELAPGTLPGVAKAMVVDRAESTALWGTEFVLGHAEWRRRRADWDRIQAEWWKGVFAITDPAASTYRVLKEAGEGDRWSAKILVRTIGLVARMSELSVEEVGRRVFDVAWEAVGPVPTKKGWLGAVRTAMERLGVPLVRQAHPSPKGESGPARKRRIRKYIHTIVWPAVRQAEADEWWTSRDIGDKHLHYNSWNQGPQGLELVWEEMAALGEDKAESAWRDIERAWQDMVAWTQLRVLGRFDAGRRETQEEHDCTLCMAHASLPGAPGSAEHLIGECPFTLEMVEAELVSGCREAGARRCVDQLLGGRGGFGAMRHRVALVGRIAAMVRRARPEAARNAERLAEIQWRHAMWAAPDDAPREKDV
jgi:hypothetical protein